MQIDGMFTRSINSSIIGALKASVNLPTDCDALKQDSVRGIDDRCVIIYQNDGKFAGQAINIPWRYLEDVIVALIDAQL